MFVSYQKKWCFFQYPCNWLPDGSLFDSRITWPFAKTWLSWASPTPCARFRAREGVPMATFGAKPHEGHQETAINIKSGSKVDQKGKSDPKYPKPCYVFFLFLELIQENCSSKLISLEIILAIYYLPNGWFHLWSNMSAHDMLTDSWPCLKVHLLDMCASTWGIQRSAIGFRSHLNSTTVSKGCTSLSSKSLYSKNAFSSSSPISVWTTQITTPMGCPTETPRRPRDISDLGAQFHGFHLHSVLQELDGDAIPGWPSHHVILWILLGEGFEKSSGSRYRSADWSLGQMSNSLWFLLTSCVLPEWSRTDNVL